MSASFARSSHPHLRVLPGGTATKAAATSDEDLIRAFECGDRELSGQLYDRLIDVVEATLFRVLGTRGDDHEDLVQSAFEQIMLTLSRRRFGGACSLRAWAASVTSHLALNAIRTRTRDRRVWVAERESQPYLGAAPATEDVEREVGARSDLERVQQVLASMKEDQAKTLVLHDVLGHSLSEIARLTGVTPSAAQSRLFRARAVLHRRLDQALQGAPEDDA